MPETSQTLLCPSSEAVISSIIDSYAYLSALEDKSPQMTLNRKLSSLVDQVMPDCDDHVVSAVLGHPAIGENLDRLRGLLGACEYALEKYWAISNCQQEQDYTHFPYIDCYRALAAAEFACLATHGTTRESSFVFAGSGPMPITAFELCRQNNLGNICCIDYSREAIALSLEVARHSGIALTGECSEAASYDYGSCDVVFLASMIGNKGAVLQQVARTARKGTLVAVRSVEKLRQVLYAPFDESLLPDNLVYLGKTDFSERYINTTLFYRVS